MTFVHKHAILILFLLQTRHDALFLLFSTVVVKMQHRRRFFNQHHYARRWDLVRSKWVPLLSDFSRGCQIVSHFVSMRSVQYVSTAVERNFWISSWFPSKLVNLHSRRRFLTTTRKHCISLTVALCTPTFVSSWLLPSWFGQRHWTEKCVESFSGYHFAVSDFQYSLQTFNTLFFTRLTRHHVWRGLAVGSQWHSSLRNGWQYNLMLKKLFRDSDCFLPTVEWARCGTGTAENSTDIQYSNPWRSWISFWVFLVSDSLVWANRRYTSSVRRTQRILQC